MTKRQLTELEKKICRKSMKRLREELAHLFYLQRYNDLMVNEGLYQNYMEKLKEFKEIKRQIIADVHKTTESLRVLQEQIDLGIDVIDKKAPVGVG